MTEEKTTIYQYLQDAAKAVPNGKFICKMLTFLFIYLFFGNKNMERFTNLRVILAQGPC